MTETILIGGTSHTGKSTLADTIALATGGRVVSTDSLARHPGRPWPQVRAHVAEFYQQLSAPTIFQFLLIHHTNMWPGIRSLIEQQQNGSDPTPLILEGSAVRPEFVAELPSTRLRAVWLYAGDDFLNQRMSAASDYQQAGKVMQKIIAQFMDRSLTDNVRSL